MSKIWNTEKLNLIKPPLLNAASKKMMLIPVSGLFFQGAIQPISVRESAIVAESVLEETYPAIRNADPFINNLASIIPKPQLNTFRSIIIKPGFTPLDEAAEIPIIVDGAWKSTEDHYKLLLPSTWLVHLMISEQGIESAFGSIGWPYSSKQTIPPEHVSQLIDLEEKKADLQIKLLSDGLDNRQFLDLSHLLELEWLGIEKELGFEIDEKWFSQKLVQVLILRKKVLKKLESFGLEERYAHAVKSKYRK